MQNYFIFLDYLELRRRVEKRLSKVNWVLLHSIVFVLATGVFLSVATSGVAFPPRDYFVRPEYGQAMTAWSIILLGHVLWAFSRSGASDARRNDMIEREMRERIQNDDTYLSDNPKDLFRIHGLMEEDIQKRSSAFYTLRLFSILNVIFWLGSLYSDQLRSSAPWQLVPMMGVAFIPILLFNGWRRSRYEGKVRKLLGSATPTETTYSTDDDRFVRLSDDGELEYIEDEGKLKKKRER